MPFLTEGWLVWDITSFPHHLFFINQNGVESFYTLFISKPITIEFGKEKEGQISRNVLN